MNLSEEVTALVPPPGVLTVTSTIPVPLGAVAVTEVAELTVKVVASAEPKWTALAPVRLVPVIFTTLPPDAGPEVGFSEVTVGAPT